MNRFRGPRDFLAGGGEMGALIRAHDWAATPLGPPARDLPHLAAGDRAATRRDRPAGRERRAASPRAGRRRQRRRGGLALLLELRGHRAEAVHSARRALERASAFDPEIVLLDIGLPEMDGYEVARRLRAESAGRVLIALTGYGRPEDVERARAAGFDAHVTKPVAFAELERILAEHGAVRTEA